MVPAGVDCPGLSPPLRPALPRAAASDLRRFLPDVAYPGPWPRAFPAPAGRRGGCARSCAATSAPRREAPLRSSVSLNQTLHGSDGRALSACSSLSTFDLASLHASPRRPRRRGIFSGPSVMPAEAAPTVGPRPAEVGGHHAAASEAGAAALPSASLDLLSPGAPASGVSSQRLGAMLPPCPPGLKVWVPWGGIAARRDDAEAGSTLLSIWAAPQHRHTTPNTAGEQ